MRAGRRERPSAVGLVVLLVGVAGMVAAEVRPWLVGPVDAGVLTAVAVMLLGVVLLWCRPKAPVPGPRDARRLDTAARDVARHLHRMGNEPEPVLLPIDAAAVDARQRRHADTAAAGLTGAGFRHLADVEAVHLRPRMGRVTLVRLHASTDGTVLAGSWLVAPNPDHRWQGVLLRLLRQWTPVADVELSTAFADGTVVLTRATDGPETYEFEHGPQFDALIVPRGSTVADLVAQHAARVASWRAGHPGVGPVVRRDLGDVRAAWAAEGAARNRFRRSIGYVTDAELRRHLGKHHDLLADGVRRHLAAMAGTASVGAAGAGWAGTAGPTAG